MPMETGQHAMLSCLHESSITQCNKSLLLYRLETEKQLCLKGFKIEYHDAVGGNVVFARAYALGITFTQLPLPLFWYWRCLN